MLESILGVPQVGTLKKAHGRAIPILNKYPREVRNACLHAVLEMNACSSIIPDSKNMEVLVLHAVMVNLFSLLDECQNHLGDGPLSVTVWCCPY